MKKLFGICSALVIVFCAASAPLVNGPDKVCLAPPSSSTETYGPPLNQPLISGNVTWYGDKYHYGKKAIAWYTRETKWGKEVVFYAAAGPSFRALLNELAGKRLKMGVEYWRGLASRGERPEFILYFPQTKKTIRIVVTDTCTCSRMLDISPAAFVAGGFALKRGVYKNVLVWKVEKE